MTGVKRVTRSHQKMGWPDQPNSDQMLELNSKKLNRLRLNGSIGIQMSKKVGKDAEAGEADQAGRITADEINTSAGPLNRVKK